MTTGQSVTRLTWHPTQHLNVWMNSMFRNLRTNPTFSWAHKCYRDSSFRGPGRVLALPFFADREVGHNRRMSNTIGRHPVTLRAGTHLIFPLSTQAADLYISCNLDSQSRLDFLRVCVSAGEGGSVGLARGTIAVEGGVLVSWGWWLWFVCAVL